MDAVEEKVVRMRKGVAAPADMELGRVGQNHPATRAKLEEIEARAFAASGRLDELRESVGLPTAKADGATKQKIIAKLAKKEAPKPAVKPVVAKKAPAKTVAVAAKASAKAKSKAKR